MEVLGNIKTADKFYVRLKDGSIEWVPSFKTAESYFKNPNIENWYKKQVFATNEDVIKGINDKVYLISEIPQELIYNKTDHYKQFKKQAEDYIHDILLKKVQDDGFNSIEEVISWKDSTILKFSRYCFKFLEYRDKCYIYYLTLLDNNTQLLNEGKDLNKISSLYTNFIDNFPKLPNKKYF